MLRTPKSTVKVIENIPHEEAWGRKATEPILVLTSLHSAKPLSPLLSLRKCNVFLYVLAIVVFINFLKCKHSLFSFQ